MRCHLSLYILACLLLVITSAKTQTFPSESGKKVIPTADPVREISLQRKTFEVVPGKESPWSFTLEPYAWVPALSGNIGVGGLSPVRVDYGVKTVLSDFKWGSFMKGEARYGKWGILGDGMFVDIEAQADTPELLYNNTTVAIQQGLAQFAIAYRVWEGRCGFVDIYAGARYNYYGISLSADLNTDAVAQLSDNIAERVSSDVASRVQSVAENIEAAVQEIAIQVSDSLAERTTQSIVGAAGFLTPAQQRTLKLVLPSVKSEISSLIIARAQARAATVANTLNQDLTNAVTQAEKKLAKAISKKLDNVLPTSGGGDRWWVDPLVGVRAQLNLTRWLFLSTQCDVGGFGAGSNIAWNLNATVGVNFTRHLFGEVGYRYYYLDYNQGGILYQVAEAGVFVGGGVRF